MDYELAKQMDDAGYPQGGGSGTWTWPSDKLVTRSSDRVYVPTLEELIEACQNIEKGFRMRRTGIGWRADNASNVKIGIAETPSEAVAKLWLALRSAAR